MTSVRSSADRQRVHRTRSKNFLSALFLFFLFIATYVLAGKGSLAFASLNKSASAIWIPTGIAIAAVLIYGRKILPAILVGAFIVNVTTTGDVPSSIGIAIGNTLEAFIAAELVNRFANGRRAFEQPSTFFLFVGFAGLFSTAVSATIGVTTLSLSGFIQPNTLMDVWLTWWIGDVVGVILIAPLLLCWKNRAKLLWNQKHVLEASVLLFSLAALAIVVYSGLFSFSRTHYPVQYLALPILIWVAFRFGLRGTAIVNVLLALIETLGTMNGYGPFAGISSNAALLVLQGYVGTSSFVSLIAACAVSQYQTSELRLRMLNQQVETTVRERTEQLSRSNRELDESRQKIDTARRTLEQLIENIPVGIVVAEPVKGAITLMNSAGRTLLGRDIDPHATSGSYAEHYDMVTEDGHRYLANEHPLAVTLRTGRSVLNKTGLFIKKPDGQLVSLRVSSAPVKNANGTIIAVVVFEDTTKEFQIDRAKTEFVSLAAHQLKTPITAVRYFVELLRSPDVGKLNPTQADYAKEIDEVSSSMTRLVSELLNVSRIDLDVFPIEPKAIHLTEIAQAVLKELSPMIKEKRMRVVTAFDAPGSYFGDPNLLRILFSNLIGNAIKFTPDRGTVTIKINGNEKTTRIVVSDTGIGIPERQQDKVFTKLFRADNAQTKNIEGTGLGLYIVKAIVERSGGTISFESTEGKGTTFTVFLPSSGMLPKPGIKKLD